MTVKIMTGLTALLLAALIMAAAAAGARAEDGYDLWLRYRPMSGEWLKSYRDAAREIVPGTPSATLSIAQAELVRGLSGLLGEEQRRRKQESHSSKTRDQQHGVLPPKTVQD